jgi:hypothetical protein
VLETQSTLPCPSSCQSREKHPTQLAQQRGIRRREIADRQRVIKSGALCISIE